MITAKLNGGLGNMMFQIAATHALSLDNDDTCIFEHHAPSNQGNTSCHYADNIFSQIEFVAPGEIEIENVYREPAFEYNKIPHNSNLYLDGYFQSEKYFTHRGESIRNLFRLPLVAISEARDGADAEFVSVHVRRGDYLQFSHAHPPCSVEYYKKSLDYFRDDKYKFLVFSDDIGWCKDIFGSKFIFMEGRPDYIDLSLMAQCDHHIIANSSFSWWGAWLGRNSSQKVIAPRTWFGKTVKHNTRDLYATGWIVI